MSLVIFNQFVHATWLEAIAQQIRLFNDATRGALVLRSAKSIGEYSDESYWQRISGLVRRRNAHGTGTVTPVDLNNLMATSVKVAAGTPPVNLPVDMLSWIGRQPDEAGVKVGMQLAEDTLADMLNTAIAALVAGLSGVSSLVYDGTGSTMTLNKLNSGASLFGDRAQSLLCWLLHSKSQFDIYGQALTNANILFKFGDVQVREDGMGRPFIVTDSPSLMYSSSGQKYRVLGLQANACIVDQNTDFISRTVPVVGMENISDQFQASWSYNLGLLGFAWDKTAGGPSPTAAALATSSNWDRIATSVKDMSGVLINTQ